MNFGISQFYREVGAFRKLLSDLAFFADPSRCDMAVKALSLTYLHCDYANDSEMQTAASILQANIDEFHRREFYVRRVASAETEGVRK